jgi:hypothetical protein
MEISRDRFLSFARRIALVTGTAAPAAIAACGGSTTNTATTPIPTTSHSATSTTSESPPPGDITAGGGPCRCSWDTNGAAAPRVCKKGEINYEGVACIPGGGTSYEEGGSYLPPVPGPLPPPDLPV